MLEHTGQAGHADVLSGRIDDVLIHFIGHHKGVVLDRQLCNGFQLVPAEHLAAGVGRVAQDQCLGTLGKAFLDKRNIKLISRRNQRDINGLCPGKNGVGPVVLVKRREDHHLVAGVADGHHGCHHGFGAAAGHADLGVGIHLVVQGRAGLFRQCLTEVLRAKGHGILVRAVVGGLCQRIQQLLRENRCLEALDLNLRALRHHSAAGRLWSSVIQLTHQFVRTGGVTRRLYGSSAALQVFYTALFFVAKSGEVWCEGARIFLNPISKHFNPLNAQRCLHFAVYFTPQYGDSFIEVVSSTESEK